jgi:hypothetical protein
MDIYSEFKKSEHTDTKIKYDYRLVYPERSYNFMEKKKFKDVEKKDGMTVQEIHDSMLPKIKQEYIDSRDMTLIKRNPVHLNKSEDYKTYSAIKFMEIDRFNYKSDVKNDIVHIVKAYNE